MKILKGLSVAAAGFFLAQAASAQVFVIGSGLGSECYEQTKNGYSSFRAAETVCSRALREEAMTSKNRAATYVNRGVLRMRNGDYEDALADYAAALNLKDDLGEAHLNEGAAHIYQKDFASALPPLNKAIEMGTEDAFAAHYNRAIAREQTGDVEGAYYDFQIALKLKPGWELAESQLSRFTVVPENQ